MAVNKVVYDGKTLVDLTSDTVTADTLAVGKTAHDKSGTKITGTMQATKPTQFTNLYDPANVVLKKRHDYSSSGGQNIVADNYVNYIIIPYDHKANQPFALRVRGLSIPVRDRQGFVLYNEREASVVSWGQLASATTKSVDEYGDVVMTFYNSSAFVKSSWKYLILNFQYIGENSSVSTAKTGPIITINEPIGNGGYAG